MATRKALLSFCGVAVFVALLVLFSYRAVYGAYTEFAFDMPPGSLERPLPLSFVENGITMNASASSEYWRQTDRFVFTGLSGGVLTNGLRLAPYPPETLTLQFSIGLAQFNADYAIASLFGGSNTLTLAAYFGTTFVGNTVRTGTDSGSISFTSSALFDRIELTSAAEVDFAVDNVKVNAVPLPGALLLMIPGLAGIMALKRRIRS
ncbi:hypothetical protein SAMN04489760_10165 [Syntrophus gentianae]|uniref:VPLPA-CTERM protein sorting domain-containing protein n=1 Tax=Syntrophus gentianae TaxID=43775 RepID=A0A1H7UAS5_9BACT|nr:hypothetical protein [Syntrophus gentianae]SEL93844.1 hypothetical protein SAMN04489760_10165 [Syntrophus gentianae]